MRNTMITGLAMALTLGGAGIAAAQSTTAPAQRPAAAQAHARGEHGRRGPGRKAMKAMRKQLLKGIKLTDAQKAQLKANAEQYRTAHKAEIDARRATMKADVQALRTARQNKDSAAVVAARAKLKADAQANAGVREQRLAAFRAVLTPDQQKQFDQNLAQLKERREAHRDAKGKGHHKGWRKGDAA